jgi:hypothetical protein
VGDSVTFGEGVPAVEDTFPQVLQDLLNAGKALPVVTVFNFGASAYSVKEMAATLEHRMAALRPDLVVMAIIPDDFNLARTPRADGYGYLVGQKARLTLDSPLGRVLRRVHLLYVLRDIIAPRLSTFSYRPSFAAEEPIPDSYRYLLRFRELAQQRGLEPLILLLPTFGGPTWGPLPRQLSLDGIQYLDVSAVADEFTTEERLASVFDPHASAAVHHRIGEELADWVRSRLGT